MVSKALKNESLGSVLEHQPEFKPDTDLIPFVHQFAQPDAAIDAYRKAIAWQGQSLHSSEQPYLNLGSLLMAQSRESEAIPLLQKAVELAPGNAICHMKLGTANLRLGKLAGAQRDLEKAVQLAPNDPVAHYQLGKLYKQMKALDRAKAEFDRTAELQSQAASPKPQ